MFGFVKKIVDKNKSSNQAIQKVLSTHQVNQQSLCTMLTAVDHHDDVLTLDLTLPESIDPQVLQYELGQKLKPLGINEINMNVRLKRNEPFAGRTFKVTDGSMASQSTSPHASHSSKGAGHSLPKSDGLPKTINAMNAMSTTNTDKHTQTTTNKASSKQSPAPSKSTSEPPITKRAPTQASLAPHPRIKHILVIASGKGGVGKSTTTVNIALALQKLGNKVGVLDADIYGPSIPTMLGVAGVKPELENEQFVPIDAHGLAMLSIGSLLDGDNMPVAWRGPKATGALMQLFNQTNWPMLDYLVIDMPPGTGDIQLTLAQRIPVTGAVIVTTPQHIALMDAQKGIEMFNKTNIPVIGVVENMALHTCSNCGYIEAIFGAGGGEFIAKEYQVPLLGQLPLASGIRAQADKGVPSVIANNGNGADESTGDSYAHFYIDIAKNIEANFAKFAKVRDDGRIF